MPQDRRCKYCDGKIPEGKRSEFCHTECGKLFRKGYKSVRPRGSASSVCAHCGLEFLHTHAKQKFCTKQCQYEAWFQKNRAKQNKCASCGKQFTASKRFRRACSPECSNAMLAALKRKQAIENFGPPRTCLFCGVLFGYSKEAYKGWCSKSCRAQYTQERRKKESVERSTRDAPVRFGEKRICAWCNSEFGYGDGGYHKWCSGSCRAQQVKDSNKRHRQQRRAREAAAMVERVSPAYIFKRDKYTCQSCKKKTKPKEATTHPLYPNLDHIIPLSKGGEHSRKNCQCLCRACNIEKSNGTLNDQLLLFG